MERSPFRIMQQKIDERPWAPEDWSGDQSREWNQKLQRLNDTDTASSVCHSDWEPLRFPEQLEAHLVRLGEAEDEEQDTMNEHRSPQKHPDASRLHAEMDLLLAESKPTATQKNLHDQMDALIAESSSRQLTAEQTMLLKRGDAGKMQAQDIRYAHNAGSVPMAHSMAHSMDRPMWQDAGSGKGSRRPEQFAGYRGRPEHFDDDNFPGLPIRRQEQRPEEFGMFSCMGFRGCS